MPTKKFSLLSKIDKYEWLIILLFVIFFLRLPSLFEPHWYGDEEIYFAMGQGLRNGLVFYKDIFDHKPPMIYIVAAITNSIFWFRLVLAGFHAINIVYFWLLAKQFVKEKFAKLSTILFAVVSTLPIVEGNIANAELFMIVPATIGMFLLYQTITQSKKHFPKKRYFGIGLLFSFAFLFKVPIGFDFAAILLFWVIFAPSNSNFTKAIKRLFSKQMGLIISGFLAPIILSIIYYALNGALEPYIQSALLQNAGYIFAWSGGDPNSQPIFLNPLVWRLVLIILITLFFIKWRNKISKPLIFVSLWTLLSTYGALLSNRPYPHYLIQPLVPFSLFIFIIASQKKSTEKLIGIIIALITVGMLVNNGFWYYPSLPYYQKFIKLITKNITPLEYRNSFNGTQKNYAIAEYIRTKTMPNDRIFVWGTEPAIYSLSDRRPVGKYVVSFHIRDFPNGFKETIRAIESTPPKFIIVFANQVPQFRELEAFMESNYILVETIDDGQIFRLINPS